MPSPDLLIKSKIKKSERCHRKDYFDRKYVLHFSLEFHSSLEFSLESLKIITDCRITARRSLLLIRTDPSLAEYGTSLGLL